MARGGHNGHDYFWHCRRSALGPLTGAEVYETYDHAPKRLITVGGVHDIFDECGNAFCYSQAFMACLLKWQAPLPHPLQSLIF